MRFQDNQHFSHQHILNPLKLEEGEKVYCTACEQQILEEHLHGCLKCHYWLHEECLNFPRSLEHPSHPSHPLTLLPKPTYSSRSYTCDACGSAGSSFSMSCAHCEFDLHIYCASLPNSLHLDKHPHELKLLFGFPSSQNNSIFVCDICGSMISQHHWLYSCPGCDFASHLDCAIPNRCSKKEAAGEGEAGVSRGQPRGDTNESGCNPLEGTVVTQMEQIRLVNEAQNRIYAAQMQAQLQAQGHRAALDLLDSPRRH